MYISQSSISNYSFNFQTLSYKLTNIFIMKTSIFVMLSLGLILATSNVNGCDCGDNDYQCWRCCISPHLCPQGADSSAPCGKISACMQIQHSSPQCKDMPRQMPSRCNSTPRPTSGPTPRTPRPKPCNPYDPYC